MNRLAHLFIELLSAKADISILQTFLVVNLNPHCYREKQWGQNPFSKNAGSQQSI